MIDIGRIGGYALVAFLLIVVPGPSVLFVISRGVSLGPRAAVATVIGNEAGLVVQVTAVALGLGAVLQRSTALFSAVKLAGACYLVYLGVQALRHRRSLSTAVETEGTAKSTWRIMREGFVVGVTNPKAAVLFTAILPQFVNRAEGHVVLQLAVLGAVSVLIALISDSAWGMLAGAARNWLGRSPRRLQRLGGTGGLMMIGLGITMAVTGRRD